jgi:hypothetical protein
MSCPRAGGSDWSWRLNGRRGPSTAPRTCSAYSTETPEASGRRARRHWVRRRLHRGCRRSRRSGGRSAGTARRTGRSSTGPLRSFRRHLRDGRETRRRRRRSPRRWQARRPCVPPVRSTPCGCARVADSMKCDRLGFGDRADEIGSQDRRQVDPRRIGQRSRKRLDLGLMRCVVPRRVVLLVDVGIWKDTSSGPGSGSANSLCGSANRSRPTEFPLTCLSLAQPTARGDGPGSQPTTRLSNGLSTHREDLVAHAARERRRDVTVGTILDAGQEIDDQG